MFIDLPNNGGTITMQPYPQPSVCPGCGKCNHCGRPYEPAPHSNPYQPWHNPYWPYAYQGSTLQTVGTQGVAGVSGTIVVNAQQVADLYEKGLLTNTVSAQCDNSSNPQEAR